jgi:hypothetical protein
MGKGGLLRVRKKEESQGWGKGGGLRMGTGWGNGRRVKGGGKVEGYGREKGKG